MNSAFADARGFVCGHVPLTFKIEHLGAHGCEGTEWWVLMVFVGAEEGWRWEHLFPPHALQYFLRLFDGPPQDLPFA